MIKNIEKMENMDDALNCEINENSIDIAFSKLQKFLDKTPMIKGLNFSSNDDILGDNNDDSKQIQSVFLKLENLSVINSFKIRSSMYICLHIKENKSLFEYVSKHGIISPSSGNFGQGLAYCMNYLDFQCDLFILVPENSPKYKRERIKSFYKNAKILVTNQGNWMNIVLSRKIDQNQMDLFENPDDKEIKKGIHPLYICPSSSDIGKLGCSPMVLEVFNENKNIDCFIVPWGGGGFSIATALTCKYKNKNVKVFTCEVEDSDSYKNSFENGKPVIIEYKKSFIDGIGSSTVLEKNFKSAYELGIKSLICSVEDVRNSLNILFDKNKIIAEGAGAASYAAYLKYKDTELKEFKNIVCVVTGGNIQKEVFLEILSS